MDRGIVQCVALQVLLFFSVAHNVAIVPPRVSSDSLRSAPDERSPLLMSAQLLSGLA
jgi:hypothetical protein